MQLSTAFVLIFAFATVITAKAFSPSLAPIIVRSPYLNAWANLTSENSKPNRWPTFWTGNRLLGWAGFIRVDDNVYEWFGETMKGLPFNWTEGQKHDRATLNDLLITPTRTVYIMTAGTVQFNVTFLSPIEPDDVVLQSFPFGYVFVDVASSNGAAPRVQVFSDLTGEWLSSSSDNRIQWDTSISPIISHTAQLSSRGTLKESNEMPDDAVLYYATIPGDGVTWQTGGHPLRGLFWAHGSLNNTKDTAFRNIRNNWPVFAFSHDLGPVTGTKSIVCAIGLTRDPVTGPVLGSSGLDLRPYWSTRYKSVDEGVCSKFLSYVQLLIPFELQTFLTDADNAKGRAVKLDERIQAEALKVSPLYNDLVSLATRQTFAGVETAVGPSPDSIYMFMKDVGSSTRVNPIETLYASFPAFLYINSTWCRYLLEPLLQYHSSSHYDKSYAAPDLGSSYPVTGGELDVNDTRSVDGKSHPRAQQTREFSSQLVPDTSAMLIMTWAHARFSGQQGLLSTYYPTLQKWAEYLISSNAVNPSGTQTADGLDMSNSTNLAIRAIIGLRSMAEISNTIGKGDDASKYQNQASLWVESWKTQAFSSGHLTSTYGASDSWGLTYNLYADKLLGMNLVSNDIYHAQDEFYTSRALSSDKFGFPFDSNKADGEVKSQWTLLTAATTNDAGVRDALIKSVHQKAIDISSAAAFATSYNSQDGKVRSGRASPAQGAVYGLLALNLESKLPGLSGYSDRGTNTGAIVGGVVGGLAVLALFLLGLLFCYRGRKITQPHGYGECKGPLAASFIHGGNHSGHPLSNSLSSQLPESTALLLTDFSPRPENQISSNRHDGVGGSDGSSGGQGKIASQFQSHNLGRMANQAPPPQRSNHAHFRGNSPSSYIADRNILPTSTLVGGESSEISHLHREIVDLRRDIEEMQSRTMYESPPQYI
ncbi:hypothetical protein AAF712_011544 [Marasmius tenuissimus]|uniref:DUF1793-domain-containing protein n=1 Tax=Marasmius tenuissimus TaxID=585030 RepID=A0ABR2ZKB9_9AGAR